MTREEAIALMKRNADGYYPKMTEALTMAIKALEQEPSEDCISRQAVLDGLASIAKAKARSDAQKALIGRVMFFTEHLPPVTPQQRTGQWILTMPRGAEGWCYKCSECNFWKYEKTINLSKFSFCPNCGAKMQEVKE